MPHKSYVAGDHVLAGDFNPNVADQVVASFANAAARASAWPAPPVGACSTLIDAANLGRLWVWTGTQWVPPWGLAWGLVAAPAIKTVNQTLPAGSITDITGLAVTFTAVAGRRYRTTSAMVCQQSGAGAGVQNIFHRDAANNQIITNGGSVPAAVFISWVTIGLWTPTAGAQTVKVGGITSAQTMDISCTAAQQAILTVEDIGPAAPPA